MAAIHRPRRHRKASLHQHQTPHHFPENTLLGIASALDGRHRSSARHLTRRFKPIFHASTNVPPAPSIVPKYPVGNCISGSWSACRRINNCDDIGVVFGFIRGSMAVSAPIDDAFRYLVVTTGSYDTTINNIHGSLIGKNDADRREMYIIRRSDGNAVCLLVGGS